MDSIAPQATDGNPWEAWREALAIALQGQYGSAKTWATVSEQARDGWRSDAAEIMASLPEPPRHIPFNDEHQPYRYRETGDAFCRVCAYGWPCPSVRGGA